MGCDAGAVVEEEVAFWGHVVFCWHGAQAERCG